jgi:hypothetical protein
MSQQIQITGGAKVRNLEGVLTGTSGVVNSLAINVPNGIPQLDGSGKILVSQLPNSVMEYKGSWNAATNTPTLVNGTGNAGDVYLCEVAGTVNFGAGPIVFFVGDQVIYSGTIWQRASGASGTVTSVAVTESGDALTITGSPITTSGTINIGFAGTSSQYINGAGGLTTFPSLTGFVPYTGATANLDLGTFNLTADVITGATGSFASNGGSNTFAINHSSGSGIALSITKGGNGEGLYINKTSGSGNAATITGGVTLLSELHLTTDLADAYIASAATWNAKQNAITLTTTGTSGAATLVGATLNIPNYTTDLSGYLPLTGGTLTGALNGTSASFSGNITSNLSLLVNRFSNGDYLALKIENRPITAGNNGSGFIAFYSNSGDATSNTYTTGKIYGKFDTNSYNSARLTLATVTGNEIYQDVLTAKDTNVGIGTINPAQTLHLFTTSGTGSGVGTAIQIQSAGTGADQGWVGVNKGTGNGLTLSVQTNNIIFNTGASTPFGGTERMRITNGGDVGIGIISPLYKLDVDGTGRFSNTLYIGSSTGFISDAMLVAQINTPPSSDRYFAVNNNGAYGLVMGYTTTSGRARIANISNSPMTLETNNTVALTLAANQTATFASSVTATSLIKTGGTSSQFLMADGSVNTSVLPSGAYLPLSGGTLTGSLSGTSATFSSTVTANSLIKTGGTSAQILAADGSVITAGTNITISGGTISTSGSGITGSGTTNYIPKFTGASSIGNSLIFDNGTNIGIGLTSPSYKLDVQDNGVSGIVDVASFSVTGNGGSGRGVGILLGAAGSSNSVQVARLVGYHELAISSAVAASFAIQVANSSGTLTERLRVTQAGNLIINTTTDGGFRLNVNGTGNFTGALSGTSASFSSTLAAMGSNIQFNLDGTFGTNYYTMGFGGVSNGFNRIAGGTGTTDGLYILAATGRDIVFRTNGSGSNVLVLASSGAATFSSSVQTTDLRYSGSGYITWNTNGSGTENLIFRQDAYERMRITSGGDISFNGGSASSGNSTATPKNFRFNNDYSNGSTDASLKLYLFNEGSTRQGLTSGPAYDLQYHSSGNNTTGQHVWYIGNTQVMKVQSTSGNVTIASLGTGTVTATSGTLSTVSDMNLKNEDGFINNALDKVLKLKPRYYHWKKESGLPTDLRQLGFYAQEVNEALGEEAANTPKTENDKWGIYDRGMIAFLTAAIQEQQVQIEELKQLIKNK